jgi:hypothetical protein
MPQALAIVAKEDGPVLFTVNHCFFHFNHSMVKGNWLDKLAIDLDPRIPIDRE